MGGEGGGRGGGERERGRGGGGERGRGRRWKERLVPNFSLGNVDLNSKELHDLSLTAISKKKKKKEKKKE